MEPSLRLLVVGQRYWCPPPLRWGSFLDGTGSSSQPSGRMFKERLVVPAINVQWTCGKSPDHIPKPHEIGH